MIYIECMKFGTNNSLLKKSFTDTKEFNYFYACAKLDNWDMIKIRRIDSDVEIDLALKHDLMLMKQARSV